MKTAGTLKDWRWAMNLFFFLLCESNWYKLPLCQVCGNIPLLAADVLFAELPKHGLGSIQYRVKLLLLIKKLDQGAIALSHRVTSM
jgi:hypothetical protein